MTQQATHPTSRLLRRPEVLIRTGICKTQIDNLEAAGRFPTRIQLGPRSIAWVEAEVDDWIAQRIAASRAIKPSAGVRMPRKNMQTAK